MQVKVVNAGLTTKELTLYTEDGQVLSVPQGDIRLKNLVKQIEENGFPIELDLSYKEYKSIFDQFGLSEEEGFKFLRISKELFSKITDNVGEIKSDIIKEIMDNAEPTAYHTPSISTTVVAIKGDDLVAGIENISSHIKHATETNDRIGVEAFLNRMVNLTKKRRHSAKDLMTFLQKANIQFADDGSIIALKNVNYHGTDKTQFVDIHTKKVVQRVGDFVCMDEDKVDPDRNTSCSVGLHIASQSYLSSFIGHATLIVKFAPEDAIAVPIYEVNKMRISGYHIVGVLPQKVSTEICSKSNAKSITEFEEVQEMFKEILSGKHVNVLRKVFIGGPDGTDLKYEDIPQEVKPTVPEVSNEVVDSKQIVTIQESKDVPPKSDLLDIKSVKAASSPKTNASKSPLLLAVKSYLQAKSKADKLKYAQEALVLKRKAKKSWIILGVNPSEVAMIEKTLTDVKK